MDNLKFDNVNFEYDFTFKSIYNFSFVVPLNKNLDKLKKIY